MSNLRIFWLAWCLMWALFWMFVGFFTFGLGFLGIPLSLLCILIPIGQNSTPSWTPQWTQGQTGPPPAPPPPAQGPTQPRPSDPSPGWKPDPWGLAGRWRYWDGMQWTPNVH